uniref:Uncharacterized protein n=1 Tax=Arundo donax TaxID=35708 RepID=A0A0A9FA83_ARUDO
MGTDVLREALQVLQTKDQKKTDSVQSMSIFMGLSGQGQAMPAYLLGKPQELIERYFHPDHMSSAEKMKLELQRVRDEFKMSENDWFCTSSSGTTYYENQTFVNYPTQEGQTF